jgi:uncharacterized membrane protein
MTERDHETLELLRLILNAYFMVGGIGLAIIVIVGSWWAIRSITKWARRT